MALYLITPPTDPVVTVAEVKSYHRIDGTDDDDLIARLIAAATARLDGADGLLGRCIRPQTWELRLPRFPGGAIYIPLPPLIGVTSVKYDDTAGVEQTLSNTLYEVDPGGQSCGSLAPTAGATWPSTKASAGAVRVRFTAGYATVPDTIREAVLLLVGHWYEVREATATEATPTVVPIGVDDLVRQHREWVF